jgi:hypothetical protein
LRWCRRGPSNLTYSPGYMGLDNPQFEKPGSILPLSIEDSSDQRLPLRRGVWLHRNQERRVSSPSVAMAENNSVRALSQLTSSVSSSARRFRERCGFCNLAQTWSMANFTIDNLSSISARLSMRTHPPSNAKSFALWGERIWPGNYVAIRISGCNRDHTFNEWPSWLLSGFPFDAAGVS